MTRDTFDFSGQFVLASARGESAGLNRETPPSLPGVILNGQGRCEPCAFESSIQGRAVEEGAAINHCSRVRWIAMLVSITDAFKPLNVA